jgi:Pyridoxamine 5'-phosphate oxidase
MTTPVRTVRRELSPDECYPLLAAARIGRLVFGPADEPTSLTVSYAVARPMVMLRTGTDTELAARLDCLVHLEVDPPGAAWSVLLTGHAARVTGTWQLHWLAAQTALRPWPGAGHEVYLRITPYRITGQRVSG